MPLQARLAEHVFASRTLFAGDTPIPVLDPGRGRTKTGRLWVYARDDQPWNGPGPPTAVYFYSSDRRAERPAARYTSPDGAQLAFSTFSVRRGIPSSEARRCTRRRIAFPQSR